MYNIWAIALLLFWIIAFKILPWQLVIPSVISFIGAIWIFVKIYDKLRK